MIQHDYHMHSFYSGDCKAPMEEMILASIKAGLKQICFTEHNDYDYCYIKPEETGMFELDTPAYREGYLKLKDKYKDQIKVCFGIELGLQPHTLQESQELVLHYPFDFIIASSHVCKKKDPYYPYYYDGISIKEGIRDYFEEILTNVSGYTDYDVYGHMDYIVRYIPLERASEYTYRFDDFKDIFEVIFKKIIDTGKGIEINTSGLQQRIAETNPCPEAVRFYKELGGEIITVGADAHKPERVGANFDYAEQVLRDAGFNHYCTFEGRNVRFHNL